MYLFTKLLTQYGWFFLLPQNQFSDSMDTTECPRIKVIFFSLWAILDLCCGVQALGCSVQVSLVVTMGFVVPQHVKPQFLNQGLNPQWKVDSLPIGHQGSPSKFILNDQNICFLRYTLKCLF